MAKEEMLEFEGTVTEVLPDGNFRVKLDNDHEVLAHALQLRPLRCLKRLVIAIKRGGIVHPRIEPFPIE